MSHKPEKAEKVEVKEQKKAKPPGQEKVSVIEDESDDESVKELTTPEELHGAVDYVYNALVTAFNQHGGFSMMDCRMLKKNHTLLNRLVDELAENKITSLEEDAVEALKTFNQAASVQQAHKPPAFGFEGALALLEKLEALDAWVEKNRSPASKLRSAKAKKKEQRARK